MCVHACRFSQTLEFMPMTTTCLKYSSTKIRFARRFLRSLARVRSLAPSADAEKVSRRIKTSSYACMARAVGTRRAWSRALMSKLRKRAAFNIKRKKGMMIRRTEPSRQRKLRELVPGGQGMDTCRLLEETAHYVNCLAIQVQVMTSIAHRFSASAGR